MFLYLHVCVCMRLAVWAYLQVAQRDQLLLRPPRPACMQACAAWQVAAMHAALVGDEVGGGRRPILLRPYGRRSRLRASPSGRLRQAWRGSGSKAAGAKRCMRYGGDDDEDSAGDDNDGGYSGSPAQKAKGSARRRLD